MSEPGHRFALLTPDNQSANIWVCAIIAVSFSTACMVVRIINRARFAFKFGIDDYVFGIAWALQVLQLGLLLKALTLGLGQDDSIIDQNNLSSIQSYTAASTIFTVISLFVVKISMILLIARLYTKSLYMYAAGIAVVGVIAAIEIEAGCVYPTCTNSAPRYYALAALDVATEIINIALPSYYIQDIRMRQKRKAKVLTTFSARLLMILFSGLVIWGAARVKQTGKFTTSIVLLILFLQLELGLSLCVCAIIPCFRMIFQSSDMVLTDSAEISRETKREHSNPSSNRMRSFGRHTGASGTDTQISYVRQATPPPPEIPRKPEHTAQRSQDTTGSNSQSARPSEGRVSESSLVPSATTGLSSKPLVQTAGP